MVFVVINKFKNFLQSFIVDPMFSRKITGQSTAKQKALHCPTDEDVTYREIRLNGNLAQLKKASPGNSDVHPIMV